MNGHRGMTSYACPSCQAKVVWRLREARDGADTKGNAGDNQGQGPLRVRVVVERWLPEHRRPVSITLTLLVQPEKAIKVLNASLYPPPPADHEPTLAEVVTQTPTMMGEAAGEVVADFIGLIVPAGDCGLCTELTKALVGAFVALLIEPLVAPMLVFLEFVSVISALLPAGDINLVSESLAKRWTGHVLQEALGPHLERWQDIFRLCAGAGLTLLAVQSSQYSRPSRQPPPPVQRIRSKTRTSLSQAFETPAGGPNRASHVPQGHTGPTRRAASDGRPVAPTGRQTGPSIPASPEFQNRFGGPEGHSRGGFEPPDR
jgi:hypothetical protein